MYKLVKEILTFGILKLKNNFFCNKIPVLLKGVDIEKVLVFNTISFGEKNYKYFIEYLYSYNKVKPLDITSAYVNSYEGQTKCIFWLEIMIY